jgi:hypothetical protein
MTAFGITFLVDSVTLTIAVAAAIRRPMRSHKVIAGVALCATGFALYQVVTGQGSIFALLFTFLLVSTMTWRIALNLRSVRSRKRR